MVESMVIDGHNVGHHSISMEPSSSIVVKGKRTKRQRPLSPLPLPAAGEATNSNHQPSSPGSACTDEEEDTANCLILLAQGGEEGRKLLPPATDAAAVVTVAEPGVFVYQCKTCERCFPSFQALGGHMASHKKPRTIAGEGEEAEDGRRRKQREESLSLSLRIVSRATGKASRVHECSICGAGFSSGQALGGHMRRHRTVVPAKATAARSGLEWDLNLPAPEDGVVEGGREPNKFRFVFSSSASSLVDCHH